MDTGTLVDDELAAIQAIYCQPGEISIFHGGDGDRQLKIRLKSAPELEEAVVPFCMEAEICFMLHSSYPASVPTISVLSDHLSRGDVAHLRMLLCEAASQNLDQPMLMELISLASEELHRIMTSRTASQVLSQMDGGEVTSPPEQCHATKVCSEERLALLHLDHMRAKTQYVKLIKKWVAELSLRGRLVFCQRLILILLHGSASAIKECIVRQRTSNVDVDSKGHPCKERMLSVLCDMVMPQHYIRQEDFAVIEVNSAEDLLQFFTKCGMEDLFFSYIRTLKQFPGK